MRVAITQKCKDIIIVYYSYTKWPTSQVYIPSFLLYTIKMVKMGPISTRLILCCTYNAAFPFLVCLYDMSLCDTTTTVFSHETSMYVASCMHDIACS